MPLLHPPPFSATCIHLWMSEPDDCSMKKQSGSTNSKGLPVLFQGLPPRNARLIAVASVLRGNSTSISTVLRPSLIHQIDLGAAHLKQGVDCVAGRHFQCSQLCCRSVLEHPVIDSSCRRKRQQQATIFSQPPPPPPHAWCRGREGSATVL